MIIFTDYLMIDDNSDEILDYYIDDVINYNLVDL